MTFATLITIFFSSIVARDLVHWRQENREAKFLSESRSFNKNNPTSLSSILKVEMLVFFSFPKFFQEESHAKSIIHYLKYEKALRKV